MKRAAALLLLVVSSSCGKGGPAADAKHDLAAELTPFAGTWKVVEVSPGIDECNGILRYKRNDLVVDPAGGRILVGKDDIYSAWVTNGKLHGQETSELGACPKVLDPEEYVLALDGDKLRGELAGQYHVNAKDCTKSCMYSMKLVFTRASDGRPSPGPGTPDGSPAGP
jgi:hypothetical protein